MTNLESRPNLEPEPALEWSGSRAERLEQLVSRAQNGDAAARRQMEAFVYRELRRLAATYVQRDRRSYPLAITRMVHETITRVAGASLEFEDQHHFYATAARIMRQVLVDYAKTRRANRPSGKTIDEVLRFKGTDLSTNGGPGVVEVDAVLEQLAVRNADAAHAAELHYFAGLSLPETAKLMNISVPAVERHIRFAKAWLTVQLEHDAEHKE